MTTKNREDKPAALNIRDVPRDMFFCLKIAATIEHKSVKELVLGMIRGNFRSWRRRGCYRRENNKSRAESISSTSILNGIGGFNETALRSLFYEEAG